MPETRALSRRRLLGALRLALIPAALVLAGCDPASFTGGGGATGRPGAVQVALLVPAGAPDPNMAVISDSLTRAAQLAVSESGAGLVTLRVYSTAGDTTRAVAVAKQAVAEGADIILGPLYAQNAAAVGNALPRSMSVLSFSNNTAVAGGNVFVMGNTYDNIAAQLGSFAAQQGKRRVFVINAQSAAEVAIRDAAISGLGGTGVQVVGTGTFDLSQDSIVAALPGIAAQAQAAGADTLLLTSDTYEALPTLVGLMPDFGLPKTTYQYMGVARWDRPPSATSLPGLQDGWFTLPDPAAAPEFNRRYIAAHGEAPHLLASLAYDGIRAIAQQASRGGASALTPQAMVNSGGFSGATGNFRFLSNGTNRRDLAIATIRNNSVTILKQANSGLGAFGS